MSHVQGRWEQIPRCLKHIFMLEWLYLYVKNTCSMTTTINMTICDYSQSAILDNLYYNLYYFIKQREYKPIKCYFIIFVDLQ